MKSVLQGPPEKPQDAQEGISAPQTPGKARPLCPECLQPFERHHPGQLFCTPAHRTAWNNRATVRGRVLTPLSMVARITRDGSRGDQATGKRAARERNALIQRWMEEDRDAGRMTWPEYLRLRYAVGVDPLG